MRGLLVSIGIWQRSLPHNLTNKTYPIIKYKPRENNSTHGFCTKSSPSCYVITASLVCLNAHLPVAGGNREDLGLPIG